MKLSSSGQSEERGKALVQAYNNTIINAGWRRDGEKAWKCVYAEKNVLANVFNNLMVNCKFRAQTPNYDQPNNPEEGYNDASVIDYNFMLPVLRRAISYTTVKMNQVLLTHGLVMLMNMKIIMKV